MLQSKHNRPLGINRYRGSGIPRSPLLPLCLAIILISCNREFSTEVPAFDAEESELEGAKTLKKGADTLLNGVYAVEEGAELLGERVALLSIDGSPTIFCEPDGAYLLLEVGSKGDEVILEGYWRKALNLERGLVKLQILPDEGGTGIVANGDTVGSIVIRGVYGSEGISPESPIRLSRIGDLRPADSTFAIIGHRGGGRNSDYLPYSENSLEMLRFAPHLGCNAVEIDVQLTSDNVPILFHDLEFSTRLIREEFLVGPVANYSWNQIRQFATLRNGEKVPSFDEALSTLMKIPQIEVIWVDIKTPETLRSIAPIIARENRLRQNNPDRPKVLAGIPLPSILDAYRGLGRDDRPDAICELEPDIVRDINAEIWAPRWTLGLQEETLRQIQSEGRRGFVWTVDLPEFISSFVGAGYDGVLSNYPTLVAWNYYVGRDQ